MLFGSSPSMIPQVKAGKFRALGVSVLKRMAAMPDLSPIAETLPGYEALLWYGVLGPKAPPVHCR